MPHPLGAVRRSESKFITFWQISAAAFAASIAATTIMIGVAAAGGTPAASVHAWADLSEIHSNMAPIDAPISGPRIKTYVYTGLAMSGASGRAGFIEAS